MTKRAGKKKNRTPGQRQPTFAPSPPNTMVADNLDPKVSASIEFRALREGWLCHDATFSKSREALMLKIATLGMQAKDPDVAIRALNSLSRAEQRQLALRLQALSLVIRQNAPSELPGPSVVVNNAVVEVGAPTQKTKSELIQELIRDRDIRAAIDRRPTVPAEPSSGSGPVVPATKAPGTAAVGIPGDPAA